MRIACVKSHAYEVLYICYMARAGIGVLGVMLGPTMFQVFKLKKSRARGLALGCASHGVGVVPIASSDRRVHLRHVDVPVCTVQYVMELVIYIIYIYLIYIDLLF